MARADLLKQLFRSYRNSDREQFMEAAYAIVEEERLKHHSMLANELTRILSNGVPAIPPTLRRVLQPPPRDLERKVPLLEVRQPKVTRHLVASNPPIGKHRKLWSKLWSMAAPARTRDQ